MNPLSFLADQPLSKTKKQLIHATQKWELGSFDVCDPQLELQGLPGHRVIA